MMTDKWTALSLILDLIYHMVERMGEWLVVELWQGEGKESC